MHKYNSFNVWTPRIIAPNVAATCKMTANISEEQYGLQGRCKDLAAESTKFIVVDSYFKSFDESVESSFQQQQPHSLQFVKYSIFSRLITGIAKQPSTKTASSSRWHDKIHWPWLTLTSADSKMMVRLNYMDYSKLITRISFHLRWN